MSVMAQYTLTIADEEVDGKQAVSLEVDGDVEEVAGKAAFVVMVILEQFKDHTLDRLSYEKYVEMSEKTEEESVNGNGE
jgi:hypothetical protein